MKRYCIIILMAILISENFMIVNAIGTQDAGYKSPGGYAIEIQVWGQCKLVQSNRPIFVPTLSYNEWNVFYIRAPWLGYYVSDCPPPVPPPDSGGDSWGGGDSGGDSCGGDGDGGGGDCGW